MLQRQRFHAVPAILLAAALAPFSVGCATAASRPPVGKTTPEAWKKPAVTIVFILVNEKTKTQVLIPDPGYLWNGDDVPEREVWWVYFHKDAAVTFKEPLMPHDIKCGPLKDLLGNACKVKIPKAAKGAYAYGVTGHLANGDTLTPIDPEIEIDR